MIGQTFWFYGEIQILEMDETPTERYPFGYVVVQHRWRNTDEFYKPQKLMIYVNRKGKHFRMVKHAIYFSTIKWEGEANAGIAAGQSS